MLAELLTQELDQTLSRAADSLALARCIRRNLESTASAPAPERPWRRPFETAGGPHGYN